jgi:hypothetical protein
MAIRDSVGEPAVAHHWARLCAWVWPAALILGANTVFPLEWSHPYCNDPTDGPAWAAYGAPLPYRQFSGVSSLTFNIMPHVLLLNVVLLAALAYPLTRWATRRLAHVSRLGAAFMAIPGLLLLLLCLAMLWMDFEFGFNVVDAFGSAYDRIAWRGDRRGRTEAPSVMPAAAIRMMATPAICATCRRWSSATISVRIATTG